MCIRDRHGETVTIISGTTNATGSSWIPPVVLYKSVYKKEFGDDLPPGSVTCMTPKWYVTTKVICQYLCHFHQVAVCSY